jgi:hypothetical protein
MTANITQHVDTELLNLRLAILKTIAAVWEDDGNNAADPDANTLRKQLIEQSPSELKDTLRELTGYQSDYPNFGVSFMDAVCKYNAFGDREWVKPDNENLFISLPKLPDSAAAAARTNAAITTDYLTEYYSYFPYFIGPESNFVSLNAQAPARQGSAADARQANPTQAIDFPFVSNRINLAQNEGVDDYGNNYDLGLEEDKFISFGALCTKVFAAAWENPEMMAMLDYTQWLRQAELLSDDYDYAEIRRVINDTDNYDQIAAINDSYVPMVENILLKHFGYIMPWKFNLLFLVPQNEESFWIPTGSSDTKMPWRLSDRDDPIIRNWVELALPQAPSAIDASRSATALACYNALGPAYPFTCS